MYIYVCQIIALYLTNIAVICSINFYELKGMPYSYMPSISKSVILQFFITFLQNLFN